jgi:hypothetical protein
MANPLEIACVNNLQQTDQGCTYNFVRKFEHVDWVDFESLVQAGKTAEEAGINDRFHKIEADLDALGDNVRRAFICLETLRAQLSVCLSEIVTILNAKEKDAKEKEDTKDTKDNKDTKDTKDTKENKEAKDNKENKEAKEQKDGKDNKEAKEDKDAGDKADKEATKDQLGAAEKKDQDLLDHPSMVERPGFFDALVQSDLLSTTPMRVDQRVFIGPDERPVLGERALNEPRAE